MCVQIFDVVHACMFVVSVSFVSLLCYDFALPFMLQQAKTVF
jgi:hypothetical protein